MEAQENKLRQALRLIEEVYEERPDKGRLFHVSRLTSLLLVTVGELNEALHEQWKEDTINRVLQKKWEREASDSTGK